MQKLNCHVRKKKGETGDGASGGDNLVGCTKYVLTTNTNTNKIQSARWKEKGETGDGTPGGDKLVGCTNQHSL